MNEITCSTGFSFSVVTVLMFMKEQSGDTIVRRLLWDWNNDYLAARGQVQAAEAPLIYTTEDRPHISYGKGALVMYTLMDTLGEERINLALNNFIEKFGFKGAPFPTSRDFVNEIRAVAGPEHQDLITDLFEKIVLYDLQVTDASAEMVDKGYEVTLNISARQFEADELGKEVEAPLNTYFDIVVFPDSEESLLDLVPLYQEKHLLQSGHYTLTIRVPERPGLAGVDPFHKMIDRIPEDNLMPVDLVIPD